MIKDNNHIFTELYTQIQMRLYIYEIENRLREREEWFETILKTISDAVIITDKKGLVIFMNPNAERITGFKKDEAFCKNLFEIYRILDDKEIDANEPISDFIKKERFISRTNQLLISKNMDIVPVETVLTNIIDKDNQVCGTIVALKDISNSI